jgi:hypothetical protein
MLSAGPAMKLSLRLMSIGRAWINQTPKNCEQEEDLRRLQDHRISKKTKDGALKSSGAGISSCCRSLEAVLNLKCQASGKANDQSEALLWVGSLHTYCRASGNPHCLFGRIEHRIACQAPIEMKRSAHSNSLLSTGRAPGILSCTKT